MYNEELIKCTYLRYKELAEIPSKEIDYCRNVLHKENHFKTERQDAIVQKYYERKDIKKIANATMKIIGIYFTPLLLGKVQIGTIHNTQHDLFIEELCLQNIETDPKEKNTQLKKKLIEIYKKL